MKALVKFLAGVTVLFLLPLLLLSILAGWLATFFTDLPWNVASLIAFLSIFLAWQTWEILGGAIYGILKKLQPRKKSS